MIALLLAVLVRTYHPLPLEKVATSQRTHVETCGLVVYRKKMTDGDWHVTLERSGVTLVLEFIPLIALDPPKKGQTIIVRGIRRYDDGHNWPEIHPVESWRAVERCK
jgi:hypothetical protein